MASNVSLTTLIAAVQLRADNHRLTNAQLTTFINQAGSQLWDKLIEARGEDYELKQVNFNTTASVTSYPIAYNASFTNASATFTVGLTLTGGSSGATGVIRSVNYNGSVTTSGTLSLSDLSFTPNAASVGFTVNETVTDTGGGSAKYTANNGGIGAADFYQLRGLDVQVNGTLWAPLKPYQWKERDNFQSAALFLGVSPYYRYRLQANNIILQPAPSSQSLIQFSYTPAYPALINLTDTLDSLNGWEEWIVLQAARMCLINEESDTSQVERQLAEQETRITKLAAARSTGEPKFVAAMARSYAGGAFAGLMMPFDDWE